MVKRVSLFEKRYKLALGIGYILYPLAKSGSTLLLAAVFSQVFSLVTIFRNQREFLNIVAMKLFFVLGCIFLMVISKCLIQMIVNKAMIGLKGKYLAHLTNIPLEKLQGQHSAYWMSILEKDMQKIETFLGVTMIQSVLPIMIGGVCIIAIFFKTWQMGLLVLILAVSNQAVNKCYGMKHRYFQEVIANQEEKIQECETDFLVGGETIRVYQLKNMVVDRLEMYFQMMSQKEKSYLKEILIHHFITGILGSLTMIAPIAYGMFLASKGRYSIADIMYSVQLCGNVGWFLGSIAASVEEISKYKVSYLRVKKVLQIEETKTEWVEKKGTSYMLEAKKWSVSYDDVNIINKATFHVERSEFIVIVGESGSGKSTLLKGIKGLVKTSGNIIYNFKNENSQINTFGCRMIYVPQNVELFEESFANNLTYWKNITLQEIEVCCKCCCIHEFIKSQSNGYDSIIKERGNNLSGGQRQRIAIARALLRKPQLLLLDESTSALDKKTEEQLLRNIRELYPKMTILFVTHRKEDIKQADKVWVVKKGTIICKENAVVLSRKDEAEK